VSFTNQQAFVIHGSHSTLSIYYAKLANSYLADIAEYGAKYRECVPFERQYNVHLRMTEKFRMGVTSERVALFHLLANLVYYLSSGKSHVGYLFNYKQNPIHQIVCPRATNSQC
jgi:hypothetical protein